MEQMYIRGIKKQAGEKWGVISEGAEKHQKSCKDSNFDFVDFLNCLGRGDKK